MPKRRRLTDADIDALADAVTARLNRDHELSYSYRFDGTRIIPDPPAAAREASTIVRRWPPTWLQN